MTEYVLGFAFDTRPVQRVLLIEKQRPNWQAGKLNGLGGKVEAGEGPADAMAREFREESGISTHWSEWNRFLEMRFGNGTVVHCCSIYVSLGEAKSITDESLAEMVVNEVLHRGAMLPCATFINSEGVRYLHGEVTLLPNVPWLVAMALTPQQRTAPIISFP